MGKRTRRRARREMLHGHMMPDNPVTPGMMADGGVVEALKNRQRVLNAAEAAAITPKPPPVPPVPTKPNPLQTPIVPGLADQMAARQAARVKAEAEAAAKSLPPPKKFLGLFADGGPIWEPMPFTALPMSYQPRPQQNSLRTKPFDRSTMLFDPKAGQMPTVGESMNAEDASWNRSIDKMKMSPSGYPMLADGGAVNQLWGGPETDNESTRVHDGIYKGPGGKWDGMPMFADGGGVRKNKIYGKGGPTEDKVTIKASPGEFVLPADTVQAVGERGLRRLIAETHTPVNAPGAANGWWDSMKEMGKRVKSWLPDGSIADTVDTTMSGGPTFSGTTTTRGVPLNKGQIAEQIAAKARAATAAAPQAVPSQMQKAKVLAGKGLGIVEKYAPPLLLGATAIKTGLTPTERYRKRFGLETNDPTLMGDIGVRALGAASDLGDVMGFGLPSKYLYRDTEEAAPQKPITPTGLRTTDASKTEGWGMGDRGPGMNVFAPKPRQTEFTNSDIRPNAADTGPAGPSIDEVNAAARAKMQEMDAAKAAGNVAEGRRLDEMNARGQLAQAKWDRQLALQRKDPQMYADAVHQEELIKQGYDRNTLRDLKSMETDAEKARTAAIVGAQKYGADVGLRGQMINAQTQLMGHLMNNQMNLAQLQHTMGRENAKDFQDEIASRAQVFEKDPKTGLPVLNAQATAQNIASLKRFMIDPTADHLAILHAINPRASTINDIPREQWGSVLTRAMTNIGIGASAMGQGMPTSYDVRERGLRDVIGGRGVNSQVDFLPTLINNFNPFAPPERNLTVRTTTPGSLPTDTVLEDLAAGDRDRYETILNSLRQSPDPKQRAYAEEILARRSFK